METSSTRTPLTGSSRSSRASSSTHGDGREVVVGARDDGAGPDVEERERAARREREPDLAQRPHTGQCAERRQRRPGGHQPHHLRRRLLALVPARERVGDQPRQLGAEDQPAVGGVVVGDEHQRVSCLRIAGRAGHVPGRAVAQRAAEDVRAAADVVDDPGCGEQAQRGGAAPAEARQHAGGRQQPERQRHRARPRAPPRHRAATPCAWSSLRIHSAARRSPSDAEGRSNEARCSTVARRRAMSTGMARRRLVPCGGRWPRTPTACSARSSPARCPRRACTRTSARSRSWTSTPPRAAICW